MNKILLIICIVLLLLGFITGYTVKSESYSLIMYHVGGLGAVGILSCIAGAIARKKGYGFVRPFMLSLLLSFVIGLISAFYIPGAQNESSSIACGGSVSLGIGLLFIVIWLLARNRTKA